jgi:hypothetical protein
MDSSTLIWLLIIGVVLLVWWINKPTRKADGTGSPAGNASADGHARTPTPAASEKGSPADNASAAARDPHPFECRFEDKRLGEHGDGSLVKEVQIRGMLPIVRKSRLGFVTSVLDCTDADNYLPVACSDERFQEPQSRAYFFFKDGQVVAEPGGGFVEWYGAGYVIPGFLEPPYGGSRKMLAVLRLIDLDDRPPINQGFHEPNHPGLCAQQTLQFEYEFAGHGYKEIIELREEARTVIVRTTMHFAMLDETLSEGEDNIIKVYIEKVLAEIAEDVRPVFKTRLGDAKEQAYAEARSGNLRLRDLLERLNVIADKQLKYETVKLCFTVLMADKRRLNYKIKQAIVLAEGLKLNAKEIEEIRDGIIKDYGRALESDVLALLAFLDINENWDRARIRAALSSEWNKWNNRHNALREGEERNNARVMRDTLTEALQRYG